MILWLGHIIHLAVLRNKKRVERENQEGEAGHISLIICFRMRDHLLIKNYRSIKAEDYNLLVI